MDPNRLLKDWIDISKHGDIKKLKDAINLVNQWLSTTHDSAISRPLFQNIPELCAALFGSLNTKKGLFHSQIKDLPVNIFKPQNIFILKLIYFQYDNSLSFYISPEILPEATRKILASADLANLSPMYKGNLLTRDKENRIMFNMIEYYLFCFSQCPTFLESTILDSNIKPQFQSILNPNYSELLKQYLGFFIPKKQVDFMQTPVKNQPKQVPVQLDNSCIFKCTAIDSLSSALKTSQFFIEALIEELLCQNDFETVGLNSTKITNYAKPNSYQIECINIISKYLVSLDLKYINDQRMSLEQDNLNEHIKVYSYKAFSVKFYRFLYMAFLHWPNDVSIGGIVDCWISWAFPWRATKSRFTDDWSLFVTDNFLFYTKIFQLFLARSQKFDFYSSARPQKPVSHTLKALPAGAKKDDFLSITEKVIDCYADDSLVALLKAMETALLSLDNYSTGIVPKTAMSATPSRTFGTPRMGSIKEHSGDVAYQYRNSGPKTRVHIISLHTKYEYTPLFEEIPQSDDLILPAILRTRLFETLERLKHKKSQHQSKPPSPDNLFEKISQFFSETKEISADQLVLIDKTILRLEQTKAILTRTWQLPEYEQPILKKTTSDLIHLEETELNEIEPGVYEPQRFQTVLTYRGREQIQLLKSKKSLELVKSNEFASLVYLFNYLAQLFDEKVSLANVVW
ncbi:sphingomyelin phosphodiesterase 4, neutral membrane (neutral sphingomyelinase-3) [Terramyces sp. JEL0728]|nr:sphingomyelin phosphodiesterase 4, neutral membrane (neutral sphingomyelinase-3) [Terramyces sp. JEL0728]KAJ3273659.1 sphingomyelin phosphodiesterase 4, neutral membrane (neutral sphingomyelinase-3) [Terramyces sp. JEL0728]